MQPARLLLADRNRHVRDFLKRELETEGHWVTVATTAQEILTLLASGERPDLLILDLEVPFVAETDLLRQLQTFYPMLPTLIHSFQPDNPRSLLLWPNAVFLEKGENPSRLKAKVAEMLTRGQAAKGQSLGG